MVQRAVLSGFYVYRMQSWGLSYTLGALSIHSQDHFFMSRTELRAQAAVHLELYLYTRDHFSTSRTELRAQAAVQLELYLHTGPLVHDPHRTSGAGSQIQLGAER